MQKFKKILSVFLAVLMLASIFSINVSAEFIGTGSSIGDAAIRPSNYNISLGSGNVGSSYYVVGYRFSVVNTSGGTELNSDGTKFRTIDLIRYGQVIGKDKNGNDIRWGTVASHGNRAAYANGAANNKGVIISGKDGSNSSMKMQVRLNKYQWNNIYRNNKDANITRVNERSKAGTNTYGIHYACTSSVYLDPNYSSDYYTFSSLLPATSGIEDWANYDGNRAALLNALGYSGVTEGNIQSVLGRNRIVIEPLYRVKWDGRWTLFSACDLAIMNYAYYSKGNGNFPHGTGEKDGRYGQYKDKKQLVKK